VQPLKAKVIPTMPEPMIVLLLTLIPSMKATGEERLQQSGSLTVLNGREES